MPIYEYKGYDSKGKAVKGLKDADGVKTLRMLLRREGVLPTTIKETAGGFGISQPKDRKGTLAREIRFKQLFQRISVEALAVSTRQLGTLLQAGVPMVDALNALIDQIENQNLKRVYSEVKSDVNEGASLADAMGKHKCFTSVYVNMVRAGESSGALEVVLERLADFSEGQAQLKSRVIGAMLYPSVMVAVGGIVMLLMLTTVVPRISQVFLHAKIQLPLMTRMLIGASSLLSNFWWLFMILFGFGVYAFLRWIKTPKGRAKWDRFRLRAPVFGPIMQMISVARFARTLSTLLASGVPLLNALQIVRNVVANDVLEKAVDAVRDAVREGEDIATPLKRSGCFPPMVTHMIAIGEKSGQLENMLTRVATTYEQQVQIKVSMLTGLLEPIMIVAMGGSVGFIVFAILTPIMQMSQLVK
jgi:general secretion pathway protein F